GRGQRARHRMGLLARLGRGLRQFPATYGIFIVRCDGGAEREDCARYWGRPRNTARLERRDERSPELHHNKGADCEDSGDRAQSRRMSGLGGCLAAALAPCIAAWLGGAANMSVYTFAAPSPGNAEFAGYY